MYYVKNWGDQVEEVKACVVTTINDLWNSKKGIIKRDEEKIEIVSPSNLFETEEDAGRKYIQERADYLKYHRKQLIESVKILRENGEYSKEDIEKLIREQI